jgi:hypothetical protein
MTFAFWLLLFRAKVFERKRWAKADGGAKAEWKAARKTATKNSKI